jgi:hypothetical protein
VGWGRFDFAGTAVDPGTTAEIRLKVSELYTADPISIPVTVVRGRRPCAGPSVQLPKHSEEHAL